MSAVTGASPRLEWVRGPASLDDRYVRLQPDGLQAYAPMDEPRLLWDFLAIVRADDIVGFASRYGLLRSGPGSALHEPLTDWWDEIAVVRGALTLHLDVSNALAGGGEEVAELRSRWEGTLPNGETSTSESELVAGAQEAIAWAVNQGLGRAELGVAASSGGGVGSGYVFSPRPPILLGVVYSEPR